MTATLRELLDAGADDDVVLVAEDGARVTRAALRERARRVASALVRDGVLPQDRVCYVGRNSVRCFEYLFGCALAGAVPAPVNWRLAPAEVAAIVADCGARVVLADADLGVPGAVALDESWLGRASDPGVVTAPGDVALQLYTSGTTGRPKGAMFAGTNLRVLLEDIAVQWGFAEGDTSLLVMPLFHMGGVAWALAGMARGATGVVVREFVPAAVLETMEREAVTVAFCVPAMLAALCAVPGIDGRALRLRQMVYSGSPISTTALQTAMKALRCGFVQIYGLTEATGAFAQLPAEAHVPGAEELRSAGVPYPWVQVRAVDPSTGADVGPGAIGEIWTRSAQNLVGYWNQPEETARALTPDGWLRTGDLGRIAAGGHIHLVDRAKDMIITGGENVYPAEVENVLAEHPAVSEVAVIGVPDEKWGETVKAVVVARKGKSVEPDELIEFARDRLAHYKCPTSADIVDDLPRSATDKILKNELREQYAEG